VKKITSHNRQMPFDRRLRSDRRKAGDRRSGGDRRNGWGRIDTHLLQGARTTASTIVHEFSRPFTIIIGYVDLILSTTKEEDIRKKLEIVRQQLQIIVRILNHFRELDSYETVDFDGIDMLNIPSEAQPGNPSEVEE
jgi:signal transduction histidine kinase